MTAKAETDTETDTETEIVECPFCKGTNGHKVGEFDDETETYQCRDCAKFWDNYL